jgi:hypothetical protein
MGTGSHAPHGAAAEARAADQRCAEAYRQLAAARRSLEVLQDRHADTEQAAYALQVAEAAARLAAEQARHAREACYGTSAADPS